MIYSIIVVFLTLNLIFSNFKNINFPSTTSTSTTASSSSSSSSFSTTTNTTNSTKKREYVYVVKDYNTKTTTSTKPSSSSSSSYITSSSKLLQTRSGSGGSSNSFCNFENGRGTFRGSKSGGDSSSIPNLTTTHDELFDWTWIPETCQDKYVDYIDLMKKKLASSRSSGGGSSSSSSQQQHNQQHNHHHNHHHLKLISIGDSLSRTQAEFLKQELNMKQLPYLYNAPDTYLSSINIPKNIAKWKQTSIEVYTSDILNLSIGSFGIFGMFKPCWNGGIAHNVDSRIYNTTVERINALLKVEILDRLQQPSSQPSQPTTGGGGDDDEDHIVFLLHSSLWDVSTGCNDKPYIDEDYAKGYVQGIKDMVQALKLIEPNASIYWRTSPPISKTYDAKSVQRQRGRSRNNQITLNELLKDTVVQQANLGYDGIVVVDWWKQVEQLINNNPTTDDMLLSKYYIPDGIHYSKEPSLAFYNMFLNTLYEYEQPKVLQQLQLQLRQQRDHVQILQ